MTEQKATTKKNNKKTKMQKPPILFNKTQSLVSEIESELNGNLICYWHSVNGSVYESGIVAFYEIIKKEKLKDNLYLFIKSNGGDGKTSLRIINLLRKYVKKIIALVPLNCASAATILTLGADEIHMGPLAFLTAVDTSLVHNLSPIDKNNCLVPVSQDELNRVLQSTGQNNVEKENFSYQSLYQYVHPLVIGAVDRASSLSIKLCKDILSYHMKEEKLADSISSNLNSHYPSHSYPITQNEAKKIGLNIYDLDPKLNENLLKLNELYSQMGQRAVTDYDDNSYHDNEISTIIESTNVQMYYQEDKDRHYRPEEKRWLTLNNKSGWRKVEKIGSKVNKSVFYAR